MRAGVAVGELAPGVPVHGALSFVDADLPLLSTLTFDDFVIAYPKRLAKRVNADGPVRPEDVRALAQGLAARFPVA